MSDYSQYLSCSVGTASFQLRDFSMKAAPVVKANQGRVWTDVTITFEGWVDGTSPADLSTKLAQVTQSFGVPQQDVIITGLAGATEAAIYAIGCLEGGPFIEWEMLKGSDEILTRRFNVTVTAKYFDPGNGSSQAQPYDTFKLTTAVRPDGLSTVTRGGESHGPQADAFFLNTILPAMQANYPLPKWVVNYNHEQSGDLKQTSCTYTVTAEEQFANLPAIAGATAVNGEASTRMERDEQYRLTTVIEFDLAVVGDPYKLRDSLKPAGTILRSSSRVTMLREQKLTCSFTVLSGADGNNLLDFKQSFKQSRFEVNTFESISYPGLDPLVYKKPTEPQRYVQSGRAVGAGVFPRPADPLFDSNYAAPSEIDYQTLNFYECETTWTYTYLFTQEPFTGRIGGLGAAVIAKLAQRPTLPKFY